MNFSLYGYVIEHLSHALLNVLVRIELGPKLYNEIKADGLLDRVIDKYAYYRAKFKTPVKTCLKRALRDMGYKPELPKY